VPMTDDHIVVSIRVAASGYPDVRPARSQAASGHPGYSAGSGRSLPFRSFNPRGSTRSPR
jgi:hypothetical protein